MVPYRTRSDGGAGDHHMRRHLIANGTTGKDLTIARMCGTGLYSQCGKRHKLRDLTLSVVDADCKTCLKLARVIDPGVFKEAGL